MKQFKGWSDFSKEELLTIAKMLAKCAYGDVVLNFNDTFAYASSYGVECDEFDLISVASLYEKFGFDGVIAWGAVKEGIEEPIEVHRYPKFKEANNFILENRLEYFWLEKHRQLKKD